MASVTLERIEKGYPGAKSLTLKGIDLVIPDGSLTVLVGPSGCGKSTLLRTIAGLERADGGRILFGDRDVTRTEPRERDVAMVFQSYALYPHLTVAENLGFGLSLRNTPKAEIAARIAEVAPLLGLVECLDRLPKALSGGQQQRVAMGRAIVRRPQLFLFDEPLSNLDAALRGEVRVQIRRLHDRLGATMIYVTHDQVEAMTLADQLVVLNQGVIEQSGPPLEIYQHPKTRFVAGFLGMPPMNFIDATIATRGDVLRAKSAGLDVVVDRERAASIGADEGRDVVVGIRPQDVRMNAGGGGGGDAIDLHFELVEGLGFEAHVHGHLGSAGWGLRSLHGSKAMMDDGSRSGGGCRSASIHAMYICSIGRPGARSSRRTLLVGLGRLLGSPVNQVARGTSIVGEPCADATTCVDGGLRPRRKTG